ncbi:MAG: DUF4476 domain-containing protein, partial [Bacteroidota bacterium]
VNNGKPYDFNNRDRNDRRMNYSTYMRFDNLRAGTYAVTIRLFSSNIFSRPQTTTQYITVNDRTEVNYFVITINNNIYVYRANETALRKSVKGNNGWHNGWGNGNHGNYDDDDDYGYGKVMSDADVANFKLYLQKQSFDDSKLKMATSMLSDSWLYTKQVKELMNVFSFDDKKLAFAKLAYDNTVDKNNFYQLSDAFSFNSNYNALADYIAKK